MCEIDSKKAQQLVHDFSCYLRGYFSELDQTALIPLSKEISHTEYYASIEKVRFPDIDIVFAVQSDDFHTATCGKCHTTWINEAETGWYSHRHNLAG